MFLRVKKPSIDFKKTLPLVEKILAEGAEKKLPFDLLKDALTLRIKFKKIAYGSVKTNLADTEECLRTIKEINIRMTQHDLQAKAKEEKHQEKINKIQTDLTELKKQSHGTILMADLYSTYHYRPATNILDIFITKLLHIKGMKEAIDDKQAEIDLHSVLKKPKHRRGAVTSSILFKDTKKFRPKGHSPKITEFDLPKLSTND